MFSQQNYLFSNCMKVNKSDKHALSNALREASKQRLQNALKQAQQRLGETKYAHNIKCI